MVYITRFGYFSREMNESQKNYSVVKKERLTLTLALQQFKINVTLSNSSITVFSDYYPLMFLHEVKDKN